ncbi:HEAT repeat domain-containing protein [Blastopirellula marina]|uniref:HEAT repeat domain-containing protein n=1 Tax=Blastopirellula marina DSM 3645 TaxID=314230 RepID=A3ZQ05_9BACT|nr:HEAT repeat domain-containing protein [Blastopirellula marina]EAQ81278.1 hypothetical protein DSM3645_22841 [Blastopirellula marina DSM 3645]
MNPTEFAQAIQMLRSEDPMTYEEGYHWLQGDNLIQHIDEIVVLLQAETDPPTRAKFVELLGDADLAQYVPRLVQELSHDCREVRFWAYNQLSLSEHLIAREQADAYRLTHPGEDFF